MGGVGGREGKRKGCNCNIISKVKDNKIIYLLVKSQPEVTHLTKTEHFSLTHRLQCTFSLTHSRDAHPVTYVKLS